MNAFPDCSFLPPILLPEFPHQEYPSLSRCFLHNCPCHSTSPHDALIIDVETSTAVKARCSAEDTPIVYRCAWNDGHSPCAMFIEGAPKEIISHLRRHHGVACNVKEVECRWSSCSRAGPLKIASIPRHVAKHLGIQSRCSRCTLIMARNDVVQDHIRKSPACAGGIVQVVPGPDARQIVSAYL